MTVRVYQSTDTGAPQVTEAVGDLIALLDACLVNGYDVKAGAGWTKPFSGTNLAAYQQGAGSNGHYLRVDDSATDYARVVGYETMTDINTGEGAFPTEAQMAGGLYMHKSTNTTARKWYVIADEKTFYYHIESSGSESSSHLYMFGDITPYKSDDAFHTLLVAAAGSSTSVPVFHSQSNTIASVQTNECMPRSYTQIGSAIKIGRHTDYQKSGGSSYFGNIGLVYPSPVDGGLYMAPIWVHHDSVIRGECRGAWAPLHTRPLNHGDTFQGTGPLTGKTFLMLYGYSSGSVFIETSDTW